MSSKRGKSKQSAASKKSKDWKSQHSHLFNSNPRDYGVGRAIKPKGVNLGRYVKWPRYVRLQRQKAVLKQRLKVPPTLNHFTRTLDKNQATTLFRLLQNYVPETVADKKRRLLDEAKREEQGAADAGKKKPKVLKYGLNHVTQLIESRKAKLVVIAHDVDPIELVLWLPALCRRMDIPYCIVKGKARLGKLIHMKTATAVALTEVKKEHQSKLDQFINNVRPTYNDAPISELRRWGGGILGTKAEAKKRIKDREEAKEAAKQLRL